MSYVDEKGGRTIRASTPAKRVCTSSLFSIWIVPRNSKLNFRQLITSSSKKHYNLCIQIKEEKVFREVQKSFVSSKVVEEGQ